MPIGKLRVEFYALLVVEKSRPHPSFRSQMFFTP